MKKRRSYVEGAEQNRHGEINSKHYEISCGEEDSVDVLN
jgi:hypothetical protein